jgi:hypothetical protein
MLGSNLKILRFYAGRILKMGWTDGKIRKVENVLGRNDDILSCEAVCFCTGKNSRVCKVCFLFYIALITLHLVLNFQLVSLVSCAA